MLKSALVALVLCLTLLGCTVSPPPTVLPSFQGRATGGTLVIAPLDSRGTFEMPRLPAEDAPPHERQYAYLLRQQLAEEIARQTRFDRVGVDEYSSLPNLERQPFVRDERLRAGYYFNAYVPAHGTSVRFERFDADVVLFIGAAEIDAVRNMIRPGESEMPHQLDVVLWDNRAGQPIDFARASSLLRVQMGSIPEGTPPASAISVVTVADGLAALVTQILTGTPFTR